MLLWKNISVDGTWNVFEQTPSLHPHCLQREFTRAIVYIPPSADASAAWNSVAVRLQTHPNAFIKNPMRLCRKTGKYSIRWHQLFDRLHSRVHKRLCGQYHCHHFPNNMPWITSDLKELLHMKIRAFRDRDRGLLKSVQRELKVRLWESKDVKTSSRKTLWRVCGQVWQRSQVSWLREVKWS